MDIIELKQYIINNNKIQDILVFLDCHNIKNRGNYFSASFPDGDNPQAITIYSDNLTVITYTHNKVRGDIITLVQDIKQCDFVSALKFIHKSLNLQWKTNQRKKDKPKYNPLEIFTSKLKSKRKCNVNDIEIYDEDILTDFGDCIHKDYCNNRITEKIRREFNLSYDWQRQRTVIPWRNQNGIVGISGRTSNPLYKELDIPKFYSYQGFKKSQCVYGFCENYAYIQKAGYVVVYESEKSVLIRASLNDRTGVALGGCNISDTQVSMILSLNCEVIIALDNDQSKEHIEEICSKFSKFRPTYYIYDRWGLLEEKDSPADANNKTFEFLMKYKVKYDENEHKKYLKNK